AYRWHLARAVGVRGAARAVLGGVGSPTPNRHQKKKAHARGGKIPTQEQQVAARTEERDRMWRLSKDVLLVADFDARLVAVNPAFTAILGWKSTDVIGTSFMELVHPDDQADTLARVAALSGGAHVFRFENRYRCQDGGYRSLSWTASPDASFIHAIGRDITADLQQADAMRRTEAALQQAQKMETIGKLTGGAAHDFNNLLQVISGNLQLIAPLVHDRPDVQRRLDNALAGVERGARLASYLLAFARRQPLAPKVVKVSRLLNGMEDMLRRTLGAEVEIETVMSGGLWSTAIDVAQVENAILNLAINARDAMEGAGRLTIEVNNTLLDSAYCESHPDVTPGQYVMIAVSDTGSGMTAEVLAQAFEPFFSTKPEGKGTGLGLSMVYGLVKQSGGHVKIYSEVGEGTTVKLYLPRSREAEDTYTVLETQPVVGGSETILVAEDDDDVRATVVDMLTELGYRVLKASDAAAALTVIDSGMPIDLLFTDVVMPGTLRSPELARKARERLPGIAVLFTSGYTENAIVHGGRLDAGVELIGKPYTKESLARKIRHVLGNRKQQSVKVAPAATTATTATMATAARVAAGPASRLNVLLVEDETEIRESTHDMIRLIGHDVRAVATAEEALAVLGPQFDVLITDHQLPGMQGDALIAAARKRVPHLQVAMASGFPDAVAGAGAKKLVKPYSMQQLRQLLEALAAPDGGRAVVRE
ncbi:MAG: response regulator, partial [Duganella sp.]